MQGCARFPEFRQNFSERQVLCSLCSVDFHTLTLQLPIPTLHSVAPELRVFVSSLENCANFRKTSAPQCFLRLFLGCARFPQFVQNFSECQTLWSLCSEVLQTFTLQLPIQTLDSIIFVSSLENCQNFSKTSTPLILGNTI